MKSKADGRVPDRLLTTSQVAERFQVTNRTIFRWLKLGRLKAIRVGGVLRISEADLEDLLTLSRSK